MSRRIANGALDINGLKAACRDCSLFQLCLPAGLDEAELELLDRIIDRHRVVKRGEHLFRRGDPFWYLYAIRSGSVKLYTRFPDSGDQVVGFHLAGEMLGLDAINTGFHRCSARALETTSVCVLPFNRLEQLAGRIPGLQKQLLRIISRELQDEQTVMMLLPSRSAESRLAAFLVNLAARFKQRGFSATEYRLSMSRIDIGNYLGLAAETVSRLFRRFQERGLIAVEGRHVCIRNLDRLCDIAAMPDAALSG